MSNITIKVDRSGAKSSYISELSVGGELYDYLHYQMLSQLDPGSS